MRLGAGVLTLVVTVVSHSVQPRTPADPCLEFDRLYVAIRDGRIDRQIARDELRALLPRIRDDFYARGGRDASPDTWRFPLEGYAANAIGGKNGSAPAARAKARPEAVVTWLSPAVVATSSGRGGLGVPSRAGSERSM